MRFGLAWAARGIVVIGVAAMLAVTKDAIAQSPSELERGRNLFRQALSMEVAGDWAGALSRLENVARIKTTPQVRYHLARCKEQLGRLTEALGDYRLAEYEASKLSATEIAEITRARQNLEARVPKIVVTLSRSLANCTVELDGVALGVSGLGTDIPANPGDHQLMVHSPDGRSFVRVVRAVEGTTERVQLDPPPGFIQSRSGTNEVPQSVASDGTHPPAWAWLAGGIGAAGLVTASAFWYVRERALSDLSDGCPNHYCPTALRSTETRGEMASIGAPVALGVGLLGLGIAAYGFLSSPSRNVPAQAAHNTKVNVTFGCGSTYAGASLATAF